MVEVMRVGFLENRDGEVERLTREWVVAWESVADEVERRGDQFRAQLKFYNKSLEEEQKRLKDLYKRLDRESEQDWNKRKEHLDKTIGAAVTQLHLLLHPNYPLPKKEKPLVGDAFYQALGSMIKEIWTRQIPLYEMSYPSTHMKQLQQQYEDFNRFFSEWSKIVSPPKPSLTRRALAGIRGALGEAEELLTTTTTAEERAKRRGLTGAFRTGVSRALYPARLGVKAAKYAASKGRALVGVRRAAEPANVEPTSHALHQYKNGLELQLRQMAENILQTLKQLMSEIMADARKRWERSTVAKREYAERLTGISSFRNAANSTNLKLEDASRALHKARLLANEEKGTLEKRVTDLKLATGEQERLISVTREQRQVPSATIRKSASKREYPAANSLDFAKELKRIYPEYQLTPTSISQGNLCGDNKGGPSAAKPYQSIWRKLMTVDAPYRGFLVYHGVGSGKTRLGWETIDQWFTDKIEADSDPGSPVLVLLPQPKLIAQWSSEGRQYVPSKHFRLQERFKTENTTVIELTPNSDTFGSGIRPGWVILHKMTVLLSPAAERVMRTSLPRDQDLIENTKYVLPSYDYTSFPAYADLTPDERSELQRMFEEQKQKVQSRTNLIIPSKTLVIVDEAHNLVNPQEIARGIETSTTTLAWSNLLKQAKEVKILLLTATPLLDDSKLSDLFKLLNLLQLDAGKRIFEGTWRRSLASDASPSAKAAALRADELETRYLERQLFNDDGTWKPGQKENLQRFYAAMVSYLTLSADPTVYPSLATDCQQNPDSTCTLLWNSTRKDLEEIGWEQLQQRYGGLPKPKSGKNILVPLTPHAFHLLQYAMTRDLNMWKQHRRLDADPSKPSMANLNFAGLPRGDRFKASIMVSWGMKRYVVNGQVQWPQKLFALQHLMTKEQYKNDKFFVFTASQDQLFSKAVQEFFETVAKYEVWSIAKMAEFVMKHPEFTTDESAAGDRLAKEWLTLHQPGRRILLFIGSATVLSVYTPATLDHVRTTMLALYNDHRNLNGEYFQAFVGDRTTKEGFNLFHTMHVVFLEPAPNDTMQKQAEARILRYCALRQFPHNRWRQVQFWRMISTPPTSSHITPQTKRIPRKPRRGGTIIPTYQPNASYSAHPGRMMVRVGGEAEKTNEEYHYMYLQDASRNPVSQLVLQALKEVAIDCWLFRDYNQDPEVQLCYGQVLTDLPTPAAAAVGRSPANAPISLRRPNLAELPPPRLPRFDRFCATSQQLLLQDENSVGLVEFDAKRTNAEGITSADYFQRGCQLANAPIINLGSVTYRDYLVMEALRLPAPVSAALLQSRFGVANDAMIIREILTMLSIPLTSASNVPPESAGLAQDLKLWLLVSVLNDAHRQALEQFIQHRVGRKTEEEQRRFSGMVDQISQWMRLQIQKLEAETNLITFLQRKPTLQTVFAPVTAPTTQLVTIPAPSAPPRNAGRFTPHFIR